MLMYHDVRLTRKAYLRVVYDQSIISAYHSCYRHDVAYAMTITTVSLSPPCFHHYYSSNQRMCYTHYYETNYRKSGLAEPVAYTYIVCCHCPSHPRNEGILPPVFGYAGRAHPVYSVAICHSHTAGQSCDSPRAV